MRSFRLISIAASAEGVRLRRHIRRFWVRAVLLVVALGVALHRPVAAIPENTLKFAVGVVLSGFGTVWTGESMAAEWPGGDWALLYVGLAYLGAGLLGIRLVRVGPDAAPAGPVSR